MAVVRYVWRSWLWLCVVGRERLASSLGTAGRSVSLLSVIDKVHTVRIFSCLCARPGKVDF